MHSRRGKLNNMKNNYKPNFKNRPQRKKEYRHQDQLTEPEVGITEYISKLEGFTGIIKARYSDFQVNEIDIDGNLAKLTDTRPPKDFVSKSMENLDYESVEKSPIEQLPQDVWEGIKSMLKSEDAEPVKLNCENLSKDDRTIVHQSIKSYFRHKIVAHTVVTDDKKYIQFKKFDKEKPDIRFQWPSDKSEYVYFLVYKEALDTMDACLKISDCLNISPSHFTYAGVKDRRAKTTQWFCVKKVEPWKLMKKTKALRSIKIGNYTFKDKPLKLGQLQGNQFRIALRNVSADDEVLNKAMEHVKEHGFINYYGLQRFGNDKEVPTYTIGVNLLLAKWKEAVQLILKPKSSDDLLEDVAKAKKIYSETGDASAACKILDSSKSKCIEARLFEALKKVNENDYVTALERIPRNMRLLYIHSFQSLIWNKMVTKRLQLFGMKPVEGDFVLVDKNDVQEKVDENQEKQVEKNEESVNLPVENQDDVDVLETIPQVAWEMKLYESRPVFTGSFVTSLQKYNPLPIKKYKKRSEWITTDIMEAVNHKNSLYKKYIKNRNNKVLECEYKQVKNKTCDMIRTAKKLYQMKMERMDKEEEEEVKCKQEVKELTLEDLSNYTIYDIVLPLPGYDVKYPENLQQYYKEGLEEYGLTLEMTKQRVKTYTLSGNYRKLLERVSDLSWKIMYYNEPTDNLIRSDFDEIKRESEPQSIKGGNYKALVMNFSLPSSCYATMILREILKTDTSSSAHARLNDYYKTSGNKIIVSHNSDDCSSWQSEPGNSMQGSSLLSDPQKYEKFKNSIFESINSSVKRKNEDEDEEEAGNAKKVKTDGNNDQSSIKTEASLV